MLVAVMSTGCIDVHVGTLDVGLVFQYFISAVVLTAVRLGWMGSVLGHRFNEMELIAEVSIAVVETML